VEVLIDIIEGLDVDEGQVATEGLASIHVPVQGKQRSGSAELAAAAAGNCERLLQHMIVRGTSRGHRTAAGVDERAVKTQTASIPPSEAFTYVELQVVTGFPASWSLLVGAYERRCESCAVNSLFYDQGERREMLLPAVRVLALSAGRAGPSPHCCASPFSQSVTLEDLRREQAEFVTERDWAQFHTPRSLALALVGEVGELFETL
jgi:hypothetical protein